MFYIHIGTDALKGAYNAKFAKTLLTTDLVGKNCAGELEAPAAHSGHLMGASRLLGLDLDRPTV